MTTSNQKDLAQACHTVAGLTADALNWVNDPENAELVGAETRSLTRMMRRSARRAKRLGRAAETPMSVSVFGPSQAGKSFLVSVLARPENGRLIGTFGGTELDYISEVNPEGEGESTGVVTRFSMSRHPVPDDAPIKLVLLSEADILRTILNSFFNDGDESETPPEPDELSAHLDAFRARMGAVQPGLDEDAVFEVAEYVEKVFRKSAYAAALKPFWDEAADIAPALSRAERAAFFAVIWGRHAPLSDLYAQLGAALDRLNHAEIVHVGLDALTPRDQSIIDVKTLSGLGGADVGPPLSLKTDAGFVSLPRSEICALTAELVFPMRDQPSDLFSRTDLLDFPGARNRFEEPLEKTLADPSASLHELLLRGKVAYLFDRYVENQEITSMLLCVPGSNMETLDLPSLVDNWIALTHGASPAQRAESPCVLFFVLTKFDMQLGDSAADGGEMTRFERRLKASLLERFGRGQDGWVSEWTPGQPFRNCFWLRNPNYYVDGLIEYDDARREVRLRPEKEARIAELKQGCLSAVPVQQHFQDPSAAWDAALALNDGGVSYLTNALADVCKPDAKLSQIRVQLDQICAELARAMHPFHVSDDVEARVEAARDAASAVIDDLEEALARHRFGAVLAALSVDQDDIEAQISRVPSTVRITSAVSAAEAAPARPDRPGMPERPERPGRPNRPDRPDRALRAAARTADDSTTIRSMSLEEFQAQSALEVWIDRMKAFRDDPVALASVGLQDGPASDLVAELIHAARRISLKEDTAAALRDINFGLSIEKQAQPAAILGAERINGFLATLGFAALPEADRPTARGHDGEPRPIFQSGNASDTVDDLPSMPRPTAQSYWTDWVFALDAMFEANAKDGTGGEINIEQNLALGRILNALEVSPG